MTPKKPGKPKAKTATGKKSAAKTAVKTPRTRKLAEEKVTAPTQPQAIEENKLIERKGISIWDPAAVVVTVFSFGRIPFAPGTWGSLFAVAVFHLFIMPVLYVDQRVNNTLIVVVFVLAMLVLLYCIGILAIKSYHAKTKVADAPEIVYDEFFAQILTYVIAYSVYFYVVPTESIGEISHYKSLIFQLAPFLFFRLFDVFKPWPIYKIDSSCNSAKGVMFDDVVAAFYASAASIVVFIMMGNYIF